MKHLLIAISCAAAAPLALFADAANTASATAATMRPETPNLLHTRHEHPNNPPLATTRAADRFSTSRTGSIVHPLPVEDDSFSFVVFGDRTSGPAEGVNVLADAVRDANLLEPDLVMTVGDLIQGYNETPEWEAQAREFKAIMSQLVCPWFPVAGNHDVYWRDRDKSGDPRPPREHESNFEKHFGPLWYAFEHKNNWFIVLFTDEGDPVTGEKGFGNPESQRMSDAQFQWLKETLAKAKGADNVFVFQHHPRWLGTRGAHERYGDDWNRVHEVLREAGNVRAVFAGHIHNMRSDPKDGIHYMTLASTGGGNTMTAPEAGYLHHYNVVTVRKGQVGITAYPVGTAMDVREITGTLNEQVDALSKVEPLFDSTLRLSEAGVDQTMTLRVANPTTRPVEFVVTPRSADSRWTLSPSEIRVVAGPGASAEAAFGVKRPAGAIDEATRLVEVAVDAVYPARGHRYSVPTRLAPLPIDLSRLPSRPDASSTALILDGTDAPVVPPAFVKLPGKTFTVEARFRARSFKPRNGLISKMHNSGFGIFISRGRPSASVFIDDAYLTARPDGKVKLETNRWYHIAQVFDGRELRLYLDGQLIGQASRDGTIVDNDRPLILGGDVGGTSKAEDTLDGELRDVRVSSVARYTGETFTPAAPTADKDTLLLLPMDRAFGPWLVDQSPNRRFVVLPNNQTISSFE